jgi:hypothetical protein
MGQFIPESLEFQCCFGISTAAKDGSDLADDREVRSWPSNRTCSSAFKRRDHLGK